MKLLNYACFCIVYIIALFIFIIGNMSVIMLNSNNVKNIDNLNQSIIIVTNNTSQLNLDFTDPNPWVIAVLIDSSIMLISLSCLVYKFYNSDRNEFLNKERMMNTYSSTL